MLDEGYRIAIIGGGKMGEAILGGWIASQNEPAAQLTAQSFCVVNPGVVRRTHLEEAYGVACVERADQVPFVPDMVILAVKPQVMMGVLEELGALEQYRSCDTLYVSIAAGLPTARLQDALPSGSRLVRVMPNTPLMVGQGASGVCGGSQCSNDDVQLVARLFGCLGRSFVLPEEQMDVVCAISGSGPAYVAAMIEAVRDGGVRFGLDPEFAEALFLQTVLGAATLMSQGGQSAEQARLAVSSPGGTTLAALDAMAQAGMAEAYAAGVAAAVRRSKELSSC